MIGPFESRFGVKEQKCLMDYVTEKEALDSPFPNLFTFMKLIELLSRNRDSNMTQNEHVYAICCRLEVDDDVISG